MSARRRPAGAATVVAALFLATLGVARPAPPVAAAPSPTGTFRLNGRLDSTCPRGHTCRGFDVSCPGISRVARGFLAEPAKPRSPRGLVALFPGGSGKTWWLGDGPNAGPFLADLRDAGLHAIQIRWTVKWSMAPAGERIGLARLACRPATVVRYLRQTLYPQLGAPRHAAGVCGFCVVGNSWGSAQAAYPLAYYGLDGMLDMVALASGPTSTMLAAACEGDPDYRIEAHTAEADATYGFTGSDGPCARENASWHDRWLADGVATGGKDYRHPATRVHLILGGSDKPAVHNHARAYEARLRAAGTAEVTEEVIPGMGHSIKASAEGMKALLEALLRVG